MVISRGGISGGLTISDALREFESRGYVGQFLIQENGSIECRNCGERSLPRNVPLEAMRRIEGASDPADMVFVGALRCPSCNTTGTAIVKYGPHAEAHDAVVLRELDDHRLAAALSREGDSDGSLVHDSGWLRGPDDR